MDFFSSKALSKRIYLRFVRFLGPKSDKINLLQLLRPLFYSLISWLVLMLWQFPYIFGRFPKTLKCATSSGLHSCIPFCTTKVQNWWTVPLWIETAAMLFELCKAYVWFFVKVTKQFKWKWQKIFGKTLFFFSWRNKPIQ